MREAGRLAVALLMAVGPLAAQVVIEPREWKPKEPLVAEQTVSQVFTVTNQGPKKVQILSATGSVGIQLELKQSQLAPGQSMPLTARLSHGRVDTKDVFSGTIMLILDSDQDRVAVPVKADVVPSVEYEVKPPPRKAFRPSRKHHPVTVDVFYDNGCMKCVAFMRDVVEPARTYYEQGPVKFHLHDLREDGAVDLLNQYKERYSVTTADLVYLFAGGQKLIGKTAVQNGLYDLVEAELEHPTEPPPGIVSTGQVAGPMFDQKAASRRVFARYTVPALLLAGVADGFNPCAIAAAIFMIVMLTRLGHDRRTLIGAGAAYTMAVFVTYYLLGLGVLRFLTIFGDRSTTARVVQVAVAVLALLFAALQVRDVVRLKRGGATREMTVQLPDRLKQLSHAFLRENLSRRMVVVGAALAGVLVTGVEAVCTGQTYVPVLVSVIGTPELRVRAALLLTLYNLGFVAPLVVILVLTYRGVTSQSMAAAARRHLVPAKLALAVLLASLGAYLLVVARH